MAEATRPFVSIVTPFYNTEPYLAECIESVLAQSHRNFEYVLVDNCSTDRSAEIARSYASRDPRIRLVSNATFLTQTQNLNHAVAQISPESVYCKIVQADDFIFPDCVARMVDIAEAHPSVGVVGAYTLLGWKDRGDVYLDGLRYPSPVTPGREICRQFLLRERFVTGNPTCTMVRADLVRGRKPFYNEVSPVEDIDVMFDLLRDTDFGFVHQVLTYTRRENDSIMSGFQTFGVLLTTSHIAIHRYGPTFLTPEELEPRRRSIEHRYYSFLGSSVWGRREAKFWAFHHTSSRWSGQDLQASRVALYATLAVLARLLNPLDTLLGLARRVRRLLAS
jgi:glycosyltransferase involved in cell wall biosynthesis